METATIPQADRSVIKAYLLGKNYSFIT